MSDEWLSIEEKQLTPALPATIEVPVSLPERVALVEACWARLTLPQRTYLTALRENNFNARKACVAVGLSPNTKPNTQWAHNPDYALVLNVWRNVAASEAIDRDRLLARQDDIVETLLTPKPILYMGEHTGFEEVEAGAASRANEVLLKAGGHLKDQSVDVNVGVVVNNGPPTLNIQVMPTKEEKTAQNQHVVIDAQYTEVPSEDEWLNT